MLEKAKAGRKRNCDNMAGIILTTEKEIAHYRAIIGNVDKLILESDQDMEAREAMFALKRELMDFFLIEKTEKEN